MTKPRLSLACADSNGSAEVDIAIDTLIVAGWTGRDRSAVEAHIEELAKLGVARPRTTPIFYRIAAANLTQSSRVQVAGRESTGEVECVLIRNASGVWLAVGSDHTDRKLETVGVTLSKQVCPKPVSRQAWPFEEVRDHFDALILRSWAVVDGKRRLYQEGPAARMLHPEDLIKRMPEGSFGRAHAMFCGTLPVHGDIVFADAFEMELEDPILKRALRHAYAVDPLPVEG